jgi:hypothetical protein
MREKGDDYSPLGESAMATTRRSVEAGGEGKRAQ